MSGAAWYGSRWSLARPLEERWRAVLDGVARSQGLATSGDKALGAAVGQLSAYYNGLASSVPERAALGARLSFSFARDVPKGAAAVAELVAAGLLSAAGPAPLRVLDLGAGLGAMTWGLVRALAAAGQRGVVEALLVDRDAKALGLGAAVAAKASGEGGVELRAKTATGDAGAPRRERADVVLVGQALSEMDTGLGADERAERHAGLLDGLLARSVEEGGALVVVEPALRERTRHLHAVRARLLARGWSVFAPCLQGGACPMLAAEGDWCHEDLPVDLPPWLVPAARAAGLRYQGLTFSYLVLRRDRRTLRGLLPAGALRVVSVPRVTKGKREAQLCGEGGLVEAVRLDRDRREGNEAWGELGRGEVVTIEPALAPGAARIGPDHRVEAAGDEGDGAGLAPRAQARALPGGGLLPD